MCINAVLHKTHPILTIPLNKAGLACIPLPHGHHLEPRGVWGKHHLQNLTSEYHLDSQVLFDSRFEFSALNRRWLWFCHRGGRFKLRTQKLTSHAMQTDRRYKRKRDLASYGSAVGCAFSRWAGARLGREIIARLGREIIARLSQEITNHSARRHDRLWVPGSGFSTPRPLGLGSKFRSARGWRGRFINSRLCPTGYGCALV